MYQRGVFQNSFDYFLFIFKSSYMNLKYILVIFILFLTSCDNNNSKSNSSNSSISINGVYVYIESSFTFKITVTGSRWSGVSKICQYCDTEYDSGIVKGTDIYDSSGYVKIGYISGNTLVTSAGGNRITLRK